MRLLRNDGETKEGKNTRDFFLGLAACNTIVPIVIETSDPSRRLIDYQGESPDEQALVYAAAAYGFVLVERTSGHIVIDVLGDRQRYNNILWLISGTQMIIYLFLQFLLATIYGRT